MKQCKSVATNTTNNGSCDLQVCVITSQSLVSLSILNINSDYFQSREIQTDAVDTETVVQLKNQLDTVMNSLATLSAEKSKMEANFQMDRKQLRNERDEVSSHRVYQS